MKTITSAKENMALLSQEQLSQAAFATLCQAFALRLLERAGYEDGLYQQVALEFLEEGQESPPPVENVFNIDLSIVLESLRKEEKERRQEKQAAEKLLTQVLQLQEQVSAQTRGEKAGTEQRFLTVQLYPATLWQQTVYAERLLHGGDSKDAAAPLTALGGRHGQRLAAVSRNGENAGNRSQAANVQLPVQAILAWRRSHPNGAEPAAPGRPGRRMTWRSALSEQDAPPQGKDWAAEMSAARPLAVQPEPTDRQTGRYTLPPEPLAYRTEQEEKGQSAAPSADRQLAQTVSDAVDRVLQRHLEDARPSRPAQAAAQAPTGQTRTPTAGQQRDRRPETASSPEHTGGQTAARPEPPTPPAPARAAGERQEQRTHQSPQAQREKQNRQRGTNHVTKEAETPSFAVPPSQSETAPVWRAAKPEAHGEESREAARLTAAHAAPEGAGAAEHPSTSAAALTPEMQAGGTVPPQKSGTPWRETDASEEDASAAPWHRSGQRVLPRRDSLGTVAVQPDQLSGQQPTEWLPLEPLELAQLDESAVHEEGAARRGSREDPTTSQRGAQPVGSAAGPKGQNADERSDTPRGDSPDQAPSPARERAAAPERPSLGTARQGIVTVSRDVRMAGGDSLGNTRESAQPLRQEGHSEEALTYSAAEGQTRQQTTAGEAQQNRQPQLSTPELHHHEAAQTAAGEVQRNRQPQPPTPELHHPETAQTAAGQVQQNRQPLPSMAELHHPKTAQTAAGEVQQNRQPLPSMAELHHPKTAQTAAGEVQQNRQPQPPTPELHHPKAAQTAAGEVQQNRQPLPSMAELHHPKTAQTAAGEVQQNRQPQPPTPELHHPKTAQTAAGEVRQTRQMQPPATELHHPETAQTAAGQVQQNRQPLPPTPELHHPKTAQTAAGGVQRNRQPLPPTPELHHPKTAQIAAGEIQQTRQMQPHFDGIPIAQREMGTLAERAMGTIPGLPTGETAPLRQEQPGNFAENENEPLVHPAVSAEDSALPVSPPQAGRKAGLPPISQPWAARSRADEKPGTASARQGAPSAQRMANRPDATTAPEKSIYQASYGLQGETLTHRTDGERRDGAVGAPNQSAAYPRQPQPLGGADNQNLRPPFPEQAESGGSGHSGGLALAQASRTAGSRSQPPAHGAHPAEPAEPRERSGQQPLAAPPTITPSVLREIRTTLTEPGIPSLRGAGMAQTAREGQEALTWFTAEEGGGLPAAVALEHDRSSRRGIEAVDGEGSRMASQRPDSSGQYRTATSPGGHRWTATTARGTSMPTATLVVQPHGQGEAASASSLPSAYETGGLGTLRRQPLAAQRTMGTSGFPGNAPAGAAGTPQGAAPAAGQPVGRPGFPPEELLSHRGDRSLADSVPPGGRNGERVPFAPAKRGRETHLSQRTPDTQALPRQPVGKGGWPEQVELSYLPQQPGAEQPQSAPPPAQSAMDSEYVRSLPGWAQSFLKEGRPGAETSGSGTQMGVARSIAALPTGTAQQEQVTWTAPQANQANRRPAEITYKQKEEPQDKTAQTGRMSDSELRRTADKVYQMIEERIRRERRRLGL